MKRILFALALLALVMQAIPQANGAGVSVDLFYNNLSSGNWIEVGDYGYGWQPDVAVSNADWRPYADGYWAYTDYGWTWVSYEDFGWATYHYGRWARLADYGWVWFPGSDLEWGPAWVSWRFGGNRCGWAPLPPRGPGIVYEGRPISGQVDVEFDIGPAYYNFIDIRYIGAPVLRSHLYAPTENVTYINETVNVTNISVRNNVVYNYGPDYNVLSQHSERPIQRLRVERESNVDVAAAARSGEITRVQGDKLVVAAPQKIQRSARQVAPPAVKTKIARGNVKIEKGWSVAGDEKAQAELKQKIKNQDLKKVPPPTEGKAADAAGGGSPPQMQSPAGTPGVAAGVGGAAVGTGAAAVGAGASPMEKGQHGKHAQARQQAAEGSPAGQPSPAGAEHGKRKGKQNENLAPAGSTAPAETGPGHAKHKGKPGENNPPESTFAPGGSAGAEQNFKKGGHKGASERGQVGAASGEQGPIPGGPEQGKHKAHQGENVPMTGGGPQHENHGAKQKPQEVQHPQPVGGAAGAEHGHRKPEGGKKKKGEQESPPPQ